MSMIFLLRPVNLVFIALTHCLSVIFLLKVPFTLQALFPYSLLSFSVICLAAGGYIVNDIYDQAIDAVNKPQKMIVGKQLTEQTAWRLYRWFTLLGVLSGVLLGKVIFAICLVTAFLLFFYAHTFKKTTFFGNFLVAFLTALAVGLPTFLKEKMQLFSLPFLFLLFFSFTLSLIREIAKDLQDQQGDATANCKTLPLVLGNATTLKIIAGLWLLVAGGCIYFVTAFQNTLLQVFSLVLALVCIALANKTLDLKTTENFAQLSLVCKSLMLIGILLTPLLPVQVKLF